MTEPKSRVGTAPLDAAFGAAGSPRPDAVRRGTCARCGETGDAMVPARDAAVVGSKAGWARPRGQMLCPVCSWMYRTAATRETACIVYRRPDHVAAVSADGLLRVLASSITNSMAILVPGVDGEDVLAGAEWGRVSTPQGAVDWTLSDSDRLGSMVRLRLWGFTDPALAEKLPPLVQNGAVPMRMWERVYADWDALDTWRASPAHWTLALRVTAHVEPMMPRTGARPT